MGDYVFGRVLEGNELGFAASWAYLGADLGELSLQIGKATGLLVFGRKTYQDMAQHWPTDTTEPEIATLSNICFW